MSRFIIVLIFKVLITIPLNAQDLLVTSEIVSGNRSVAYQHLIDHTFNKSWSVNNITLFDTEYANDDNTIYFIRNMVSLKLPKSFKINAAFGIKNPGAFVTFTAQYQFRHSTFKMSYAIGSTYQNGLTLEQTLLLNYTPRLSKTMEGYVNLFVVVNTNLKVLDRSLQQLRLGVKQNTLTTGIAVNLDQFTNAVKTLENYGVFIKYNF